MLWKNPKTKTSKTMKNIRSGKKKENCNVLKKEKEI